MTDKTPVEGTEARMADRATAAGSQTINPEPVTLSEKDLLWLAVHENGGDVVIPVQDLVFLPRGRSVSVAFSDDKTLMVITASGSDDGPVSAEA